LKSLPTVNSAGLLKFAKRGSWILNYVKAHYMPQKLINFYFLRKGKY
jgi:hypothetical protein